MRTLPDPCIVQFSVWEGTAMLSSHYWAACSEEDIEILIKSLNSREITSNKLHDEYFSEKFLDINMSDSLMNFGMTDVENVIEKYLTKIKDSTRKEYTKMTAVLMNQYLSDDSSKDVKDLKKKVIGDAVVFWAYRS